MMRTVVLMTLVAGSAAAHAVVAVAVGAFVASDATVPGNATESRITALNVRSIAEPEEVTKVEPSIERNPQQSPEVSPTPASDSSDSSDTNISADPVLRAHYYESHEVDVPAAPQPDWEVDADQLVTSGVRKLSFAVWVDERGVARKCKVISMDPAGALKPEPIAARLCRTTLTPAVRRGVDVASVRHIELVLAQ